MPDIDFCFMTLNNAIGMILPWLTLVAAFSGAVVGETSDAATTAESYNYNMAQPTIMHASGDNRISLGLSPVMKQHQLVNMRSHLEAVQAITRLLAEQDFAKASKIAHSKLGLTEEMRRMCSMSGNEAFTAMGLAFHESGDELGRALATRDTKQSLRALQNTLGYCVQCHATFRQ